MLQSMSLDQLDNNEAFIDPTEDSAAVDDTIDPRDIANHVVI